MLRNKAIAFLVTGVLLAGSAGAQTQGIPGAPYTPKPAEVAGIAAPVLSLNGTWSFNPAPPKGFEKDDGHGR